MMMKRIYHQMILNLGIFLAEVTSRISYWQQVGKLVISREKKLARNSSHFLYIKLQKISSIPNPTSKRNSNSKQLLADFHMSIMGAEASMFPVPIVPSLHGTSQSVSLYNDSDCSQARFREEGYHPWTLTHLVG